MVGGGVGWARSVIIIPTPPNAHMGTSTTQSVHSSIEACYKTPVGHFHVEHEAHGKVEVQHPRYVNPRRVGKKKPLDRQTPGGIEDPKAAPPTSQEIQTQQDNIYRN
jgi:hypothetical protein